MKLIKTNDGLFGWILNGKMIWCDTRQELYSIGWHHVATRKDDEEYAEFCNEVEVAIDAMTQSHKDCAEFGVFGTFMYPTNLEESSEF